MNFRMFAIVLTILCVPYVLNQTAIGAQTSSFTYQGKLNDGGSTANGQFDYQFKLFDLLTAGTQQGPTVTLSSVVVTNGIFTVQLDFGVNAFNGADRFLEIALRHNSSEPYVTLSPRQPVTSVPYAVRANSAGNATQLGGVNASQYVQTNDVRLSDPRTPTPGSSNYIQNSTTTQAGNFNINGDGTVGGSFSANYIAVGAPFTNYRLSVFHGGADGILVKSEASYSTLDIDAANGDAAVRFYRAGAFQWDIRNNPADDSLQFFEFGLGERLRIQNHSGNIGINLPTNMPTPQAKLHIFDNNGNILFGNGTCNPGFAGIGFAPTLTCANYSLLGEGTNTILNRPSGGMISFRENNVPQMSLNTGGTVSINTLGAAGSTQLCRNASNQISTCSSSLRYKKDLQPFTGGLAVVNRLYPLIFRWKADNAPDVGFGAEDIAKVEPLLVTYNDKGQVEGVKYDRISAALVNAVKEQQTQIEQMQKQLIALKKLLCSTQCKPLKITGQK